MVRDHLPSMLAALDDMEIWEIAEALGVDHETQGADGTPLRSGRGRALALARMRAHAAGLPEPAEHVASGDEVIFMEQFRRLAEG